MKDIVVSCLAASFRVVSSCACTCKVRSSSSTFNSRAATLAVVKDELANDGDATFTGLLCKAIPRSERMDFSGSSCMYRKIVSPECFAMILILFVSRPRAA